ARLQNALGSDRVVWTALGDTVRHALLARRMIESAPIAVVYADVDGHIRYLNPAARRLLDPWREQIAGTPPDLIGQPLAALCGDTTADPGSRARRMEVQVGPDSASVLLSSIPDDGHGSIGTMAMLSPVPDRHAQRGRERSDKAQVAGVLSTVRGDV